MQSENLNVFDFDGTLIKVNSFQKITKSFLFVLLKKLQIAPLLSLLKWYILRRLGIISHLVFKKHVVSTFEKSLREREKQNICQKVFNSNVNKVVFERFMNLNNCIICTASPIAYVSRICFGKNVFVIGSLSSQMDFPDPANFGRGKIDNLTAYFKDKNVQIVNFYTDSSTDDQAMIDLAINAFVIQSEKVVKIK